MDLLIGLSLAALVDDLGRPARSAMPDAPTVPEREPTPRIPATRRALATGLRWVANRIEPRSRTVACP
jgi:hypothetical protein